DGPRSAARRLAIAADVGGGGEDPRGEEVAARYGTERLTTSAPTSTTPSPSSCCSTSRPRTSRSSASRPSTGSPASARLSAEADFAGPYPAARFLLETTARHPGEVTLVVTGPLTNLATALALDPTLPARLPRVVVMGVG